MIFRTGTLPQRFVTFFTFYKKLLIGFIVSLVILITVMAVGIDIIKKLNTSDDWVAHTYEVIDLAHLAADNYDEVEVRQSLFDQTHNQQILNAAKNASGKLKTQIEKLRALTIDNPSQTRRIDLLRNCLEHTGSERVQPKQMVGTYRQDCQAILNDIVNTEKTLLKQRKQSSRGNSNLAFEIIFVSSLLDIVFLGGLYFFIKKTFREKQTITDRLKISEAKFASAFSDSASGMAIVSLEGEWMEVNNYLERLLGYSKEELYKTTFLAITHPDDIPANRELLKRVQAGEINQFQIEKRLIHKDGTPIWVMVNVSIIHNLQGESFAVSQIIDISALKELMGKMELKNTELSHTANQLTEKLTQLEDFNNIVAHNLRGPVKTIGYVLQLIAEEESEDEKQQYMAMLSEISNSLNDTLDDLLKVLEIKLDKTIKSDSCALQDVTDNISLLLKGDILKANALITTHFDVKRINFPRIYLESIFYNLVSNSLKYRRDDVQVEIKISSTESGEKTFLIFEDNGIGIDLARHGKDIFKLNKVFHSGFDSKGVGLFITKNQIEAHGGTIEVESVPGCGTKFTIALVNSSQQVEELAASL
ncbi:MAG TPA: PAS domain S-box protein [Mucilaginibacter sp.]|jgi:PAS domain S-box-containing protein|nr:PAS domain S-box protein [Mucilaginibacter sp.]